MSKIKLSTQELKRQKEDLKRYRRFLPTLILKKLQIRIELSNVKSALRKKLNERQNLRDDIRSWIAVLGDEAGIRSILKIDGLEIKTRNVCPCNCTVTGRFEWQSDGSGPGGQVDQSYAS